MFRDFFVAQSKAARNLHVHTITNAKSKKDHVDTAQARFRKISVEKFIFMKNFENLNFPRKCFFLKMSKACRFNKCLMVGMKRECIMSDEQILKKVSYSMIRGTCSLFCNFNFIFSEHSLPEIA